MSPHDSFFSTGTACDACDKYEVWTKELARCHKCRPLRLTHSVIEKSHFRIVVLITQCWQICAPCYSRMHLGECMCSGSTRASAAAHCGNLRTSSSLCCCCCLCCCLPSQAFAGRPPRGGAALHLPRLPDTSCAAAKCRRPASCVQPAPQKFSSL